LENAKTLFDAGANVLVTGSAVFNSENPKNAVEKMLDLE
jgi:pentose-5-phosphate-3-epimerase